MLKSVVAHKVWEPFFDFYKGIQSIYYYYYQCVMFSFFPVDYYYLSNIVWFCVPDFRWNWGPDNEVEGKEQKDYSRNKQQKTKSVQRNKDKGKR